MNIIISSSRSLGFVMILALPLLGCKKPVTDEEAYAHGICSGAFPGAEVAIGRGRLRYPEGTFEFVASKFSESFDAPITWDAERFKTWESAMRDGQMAGRTLMDRGPTRYDLGILERCIQFARGL